MFNKIWERYFVSELLKSCFFLIACFYGLYVLLDYANHSASFQRHHIAFQWKEVASYYLYEFANRIEILLPFALLIGTIRTLTALNKHNELVALMSSGVSLKKLLLPFVYVGIAGTLLIYINSEFFLPSALNKLKHIDESRTKQKAKYSNIMSAQHIALADGSRLLFQHHDSIKNAFFDVYWIRNIDDIYRIKQLFPSFENDSESIPKGYFVDHITRNSNGQFAVSESFHEKIFPEIKFNKVTLFETIMSPEELSLTQLWEKLPQKKEEMHEKESQILSLFYRKLLIPWLCLLAVIGPATYCLKITRNLPQFLIYAGSIFGLITIYIIIGASVILGKKQVVTPFWAIIPPFLIFFSYFSWRFLRVR